jgi:hypothetical protein
MLERRHGIRFPAWFRNVATTLTLVNDFPQFRVDDYTHWTPRTDNPHPIWYTSEWGYANDQERHSFIKAGVYPVALWIETALSYLAINISDDEDLRIYEFTGEDIVDDIHNNLPADSSVFPAYNSYTEMISHIIELRLPDESIVRAR